MNDRGIKGIFGNLYIMLLLGRTSEHVHSRQLYILSNNQGSCYPAGMQSVFSSAYHRLSENFFHSAVSNSRFPRPQRHEVPLLCGAQISELAAFLPCSRGEAVV